jgi:ATP-binding cassette subfamily B protein/subfamily B ATP-binding cassette protein MsbA
LIRRLWNEHITKYRGQLMVAVILMAIEGAAIGAFAWLLRPLFDTLFADGTMDGVGWLAGVIVGLFLIRAVAGVSKRLLMAAVGLRVTLELQSRLVRHLLQLDMSFFQSHPPGALIERVRGDTGALQGAASSLLITLGRDTVSLVALISVMFINDWVWALIALVGAPIAALPIFVLQRFIRKRQHIVRQAASQLSSQLNEMFHGVQSIKLNRLEDYELSRFQAVTRSFRHHAFRSQAGIAIGPGLIDLMAAAGVVAVLYYGGAQIIAGEKTIGTFMSFFTALGMVFDPMRRLSTVAGQLQAAATSLDRLYAVLETDPTILSPAAPAKVKTGDIRFDNVHFDYGHDPVLRGLSFIAEDGKTTALVGPSGAGKTTVFGLLTRLIDPQSGQITIGDVPVDTLDIGDLRDEIAVMGQETALFNTTIAQNIRLGNLGATDEQIRAAAKSANVLEFTDHMPQGLDTPVGPRGSGLSGGQRQRVAIARAFLKSAPILLMDEPTSALDAGSEVLVQQAMRELSKKRTTLIIAHRLSTIRDADKIVVLEHGQVVEQGAHDALIAKGGAYARLHDLQAKGLPI